MSFYDDHYGIYKKLYFAEVLTYGHSHPIKVGISKNPHHRMRQLGQMGIHCPELIGYFEYNNYFGARDAETILCQEFPRCPTYSGKSREVLVARPDDLYEAVMTTKPAKFIKVSELHYFRWEVQ